MSQQNGDAAPAAAEKVGFSNKLHYHTLPENPTLYDRAVLLPLSLCAYFRRLCDTFGRKYVMLVIAVYCINQGIGEGFAFFAMKFMLSDSAEKGGLAVHPDEYNAIDGVTNVPWQIKALYGVISDTLPIGGYHRTPFIGIAGAVGVVAFGCLSILPMTTGLFIILFLLANFSMASPDVMIDASVAERCQSHPAFSTDLQTLCWGTFGVGKVLSGLLGGVFLHTFGTRGMFAICIGTSLCILYPAVRKWLPEKRDAEPRALFDFSPLRKSLQDPTNGILFKLALIVCGCSLTMGIIANASSNNYATATVGIIVGCCVCVAVYKFESSVSPVLAKVSVYIFLVGALQPTTNVMYYWYRSNEDNCGGKYGHRPCFSAEFIGYMDTVGYVFFTLGTVLYNRYFSSWSYRSIWTATQVLLVFVNLLDLFWVLRVNLSLGISDHFFMFGEEVITPMIRRLNTMPVFILAAKLCPEGAEATVFALTMGLSNFGVIMGGYLGIGVLEFFGGVDAPEFNNLTGLVIMRSLTRLLPIALIPCLIPEGSPMNDSLQMKKAEDSELEMNSLLQHTDEGDLQEGGDDAVLQNFESILPQKGSSTRSGNASSIDDKIGMSLHRNSISKEESLLGGD